MDQPPKHASASWIAAQLMLLCGFQVICVVIVAAICIVMFPPEWGVVASVVSAPAAMAVGIICAVVLGRKIRG